MCYTMQLAKDDEAAGKLGYGGSLCGLVLPAIGRLSNKKKTKNHHQKQQAPLGFATTKLPPSFWLWLHLLFLVEEFSPHSFSLP